ncbi:MAG: hypothetical protein AUJ98_04060 [Bacteroidetes bacterium CG2_30_33_31]|nr:MAG: hypothetical protein AUJ98_04060 [Bacteroidetes bacterium CG2_30_33_31]
MASVAQEIGKIVIGGKSYNQFYQLNFNIYAASNSISNKMIFNILSGGKIDKSLISANQGRLKSSNIFGYSTDFAISYKQENRDFNGLKGIGFQSSFEWHNLMELNFGKDLFNLFFIGNSSYAGKTVDLSSANYYNLNYYQIKAGLNKISKNKFSKYGFNVDLNLGNNFDKADFRNSSLFTSAIGDSISFDGNLGYKYLDTSKISISSINGYGVGIDVFYAYENPQLFKITAKISNFGFISWTKKSHEFIQKEPIIWQGIEVTNIFKMPDPLMNVTAIDTFNEYLSSRSFNTKFHTFTPCKMEFEVSKFVVKDKFELQATFQYQLFSSFRSLFILQSNFFIKNIYQISPNISYGGYSAFNVGIDLKYNIKNYGIIYFGTKYLSGYILQNNFSGFGGFITFTFQL